MSGTAIICGYGPGISEAVATKFGKEGFQVAIVARNADNLAKGVERLKGKGVNATAFPADLSNIETVKKVIGDIRSKLGNIKVLVWNPVSFGAGDFTTVDLKELQAAFDIGIFGLLAGVQAVLPDLKGKGDGAILITGGGIGRDLPEARSMTVSYNLMGLSLVKNAQNKIAAYLEEKLRPDGVYVGEVMVTDTVKGTPGFDQGQATLEGSAVADLFFKLYKDRKPYSVQIPG